MYGFDTTQLEFTWFWLLRFELNAKNGCEIPSTLVKVSRWLSRSTMENNSKASSTDGSFFVNVTSSRLVRAHTAGFL